jgi:subfamily B ATP-binding cassette protein MsbA
LRIIDLVRPHWKALTVALVAVLGETLTDILEPWPIKVVVDNLLQGKQLPAAPGRIVTGLFGGQNAEAMLNFAVAAVALTLNGVYADMQRIQTPEGAVVTAVEAVA